MQLARGFFLTPEKRIKRKIIEIVITFSSSIASQEADLRDVRQPDQPRPARQLFHRRLRRGRAGLLRQGCAPARPGRVRAAGRHHSEPQPTQSLPPRGPRHRAAQPGARFDGRDRRHHQGPGRARQGRAAASLRSQRGRQRGALLRRPGARSAVQKLGERDFNREGLRIYTSLDPDLQRLATRRSTPPFTWSTSRWTSCTRATKSWASPTSTRRWRWSRSIRTPARCWRWWAGAATATRS
jgi:penicillin-binding protein 1B